MQNDADGPNVAPVIVAALDHLRGHVVRRAERFSHVKSRVHFLRCAEIYNLDSQTSGITKHNVFWLDVPVDDIVFVQIVDGLQDLLNDTRNFVLFKPRVFLGNNALVQVAAQHHFHHDVDSVLVLKPFEDLHNVRVVKGLHQINLVVDPLQKFLFAKPF